MSAEDKKVEETTEVKPEVSTSEEDATKKTTEPTKGEEDTPDYEALYQEEKERREKAEHKIVKLRAKTLETPEEIEVAQSQEDIKSYVDKRLTQIEISTQESLYDAEIAKVSSNDSEAKLIRLLLEDNNFSGSVPEKVRKAKAIANFPKVARVNKELSKALGVKPGGENSPSYKPQSPKVLSGLSEADIAHLKKRGLYEKYLKQYGK